MQTPPPLWAWGVLGVTLAVLLAVDLVSHGGGKSRSTRADLAWSVIWIGAGLAFNGFVWAVLGRPAAEQYLAAYLIEKSLSVDNLFVFLIIFRGLRIPQARQRRVLTFGILGALTFRAVFVFAGITAIERWQWVLWVFAGILIVAAARIAWHGRARRESRAVAFLERHLPFTRKIEGDAFVLRAQGRRVATPLLLALLAVEITDILFAVDSVPAALAVSREPFVIYSSNAFAILGLRSLYALLGGILAKLEYLHYGLAAILAFAAFKMIASPFLHIPALVSVSIILSIIAAAVAASVWRGRHRRPVRLGRAA